LLLGSLEESQLVRHLYREKSSCRISRTRFKSVLEIPPMGLISALEQSLVDRESACFTGRTFRGLTISSDSLIFGVSKCLIWKILELKQISHEL
jgi:hypothetical protein